MLIDLDEDSGHIVLGQDPGAPKDASMNLTGRTEALFSTGEFLVSVPNKNNSGARMGSIIKGSQQGRCERGICVGRECQDQINSADRIRWEGPACASPWSGRTSPEPR